jgi:malonyl-CoA O-methyltransferase
MPADDPARSTRRAVDEIALQRTLARLQRAPRAPWLHAEAARRQGERLAIVKLQPRQVIDWWSHLGGGFDVLSAAYPKARIQSVEPLAGPAVAAPWWSPRRWVGRPAPIAESDVPAGQAELLWANMMLHAVADPPACLRAWHRALANEGFLMFSTFGPGSLASLRHLYGGQGWGAPMAPLVDMHDLGDMLVEAGFADPVMDQETVTLTFSKADDALSDLRSLGSNVEPARMPGLRTPRWRRCLLDELERVATQGSSGRVELTFELVYGHAFKPLPRPRVAAESSVSLNDMRAMVRGSRPRRP